MIIGLKSFDDSEKADAFANAAALSLHLPTAQKRELLLT
jgi:hypothetical protein